MRRKNYKRIKWWSYTNDSNVVDDDTYSLNYFMGWNQEEYNEIKKKRNRCTNISEWKAYNKILKAKMRVIRKMQHELNKRRIETSLLKRVGDNG